MVSEAVMNSLRGFLSWDDECTGHIESFEGQMEKPRFNPEKAIRNLHRDVVDTGVWWLILQGGDIKEIEAAS